MDLDDDLATYLVKLYHFKEELKRDYNIEWPTTMKINHGVNEISNIEQFKARDMMDWEDDYDQDKTWVHSQSFFKKNCMRKTRYGSGSPLKHGIAESAANVRNEITKNLEERLSINLCKMAIADTEDKDKIQQISNT